MSPRNVRPSFHGISQNFERDFTAVNGSPRHSEWTGKVSNLEIQIL